MAAVADETPNFDPQMVRRNRARLFTLQPQASQFSGINQVLLRVAAVNTWRWEWEEGNKRYRR